MLSCSSFFDSIPVELHNRRVFECRWLCVQKGEIYAEATLETDQYTAR
jgi:hypothetical protein